MVVPDPVRIRTVYQSPTRMGEGQSGVCVRTTGTVRRRRGTGWQRGQKKDERFMNATRRIGVPQRSQGSSARP